MCHQGTLAVFASYYKSYINATVFVRKVLNARINKLIVLAGGGQRYPWPVEMMGIRWLRHVLVRESDKEVLPNPQ